MGKRIDCFDKIKHKEVKQLQQAFNDLVPEDTGLSEQEQKEIGKKIALDYYKQVNEELAGLKNNIAGVQQYSIPGGEKLQASPVIEEIEEEAEKEIKKVDPKIPVSKLPVKAKVAQRKVRDEKLAGDIKAKLHALKNMNKGGATFTSGGIDPQKLERATELIGLYIKAGVYKFSDIIEDAYAELGEEIKALFDILKTAYGGYYMSEADQVEAEQMDLTERNLTFADITSDMVSEAEAVEDFEKVEKAEPRRQFIDTVKERIEKQEKQNIVSLRKLAAELDIDVVDTNLQEMVEMAVVELSREVANKSWQEKYILEGIIDIYDNQPTISMRSANRIELQQYSTPTPTAYLAGLYVNAGKPKSVFEPSAGNGIMTIAFKPEIVSVNEIDPVRLDNLAGQGFKQVTNQDALQPFPAGKKYDGLVMNPPFGSSEQIEVDGYKISGLAQKMAINALKNLDNNGRAAIIIGGHSEFDDKGRITTERTFFNWLYNQYNVAAVINISGELYAKQGTQFPTRLILIHSKKAVAEGATPINKDNKVVTSFYELLKIINDLKNVTYENILQPGMDANRNDGNAIHGKSADQLQPDNEGRLPAIPPGQVRPNNTGRPSSKGKPGLDNGDIGDSNTDQSDSNGLSQDDNGIGPVSDLEGNIPPPQPGIGDNRGPGNASISGKQPVQLARKFESGELSGKAKVPYVPKSSSQSVDTVIPSRMATDAENILTQINNEYGGIDNFVQKKLGYATKEELFNALSGEQVDAVAMTIVQIENGQGMIIGDMTGVGKGRSQPLDAKILTNTGWVNMGDLKIGTKIISVDGNETKVLGIYPQGKIDVYEVLFTDGTKTECSLDHLWAIKNKQMRDNAKKKPDDFYSQYQVKSLKEIEKMISRAVSVPMVQPVNFIKQNVPIDPYLLGVLLGDGAIRQCGIELTNVDAEILSSVSSMLPDDLSLKNHRPQHYNITKKVRSSNKNSLLNSFRDLQLSGKTAAYKFVPEIYKINSFEVRLSVLQGLIDTDGYVNKKGSCFFYSVSERLADDVIFIVQSLGGIARKAIKKTPKLPCYVITITLPNNICPVRLLRKKERIKDKEKYPPIKYIKSIKKIGVKECQCIKVDHPSSLYVTDSFIVTHNTAAALLRYGINQGLKPIFLTETPGLFSDLYRDLVDIDPTPNKSWSKNVKPFIVNDKNSSGDPTITDKDGNVVHKLMPAATKKGIFNSRQIPKDANFVLATYSQFSTSSDKPSMKKDFFSSISEGNILILDESHNVAGQSNRGEFFKEAIISSKGVLYLSATFAKTPQAMPVYAMKTAMQEANMSSDELVRAIEHGGVALQEVVAAQLVESGQMLRRERSFDGVSVDYEVLEETGPAHREIADSVTEIIRDVIEFQATHVAQVIDEMDDIAVAAGARMTPRGGTNMAGVNNQPFASKVFNVIDQLLFSIKAMDIADAAIEELKAGRKPVIGFKSTMGSFLDHIGVQPGERLEKIDFSLTLKRALEGVMRYTEKDAQGNSIPGTISLADLSDEGRAEFQRILDKILKASSGITISPIDVMIKRIQDAGYTVKEITGRKIMLEIQDDGSAIVATRFEKDKKKIVREFNDGDLDVVMLNMSGATGISMHASSKFKDQRQRVMIDGQLELDINKAVQKRGRIDRVGQVVRGAYRYIVSAIQAESRLLMMFKRKLKSLDANTTSSQKSIKTADVVDFLNKYGDEIVTEYLKENRDLNDKLLDPLKFNDKSDEELDDISKVEGAALKVTGRVAILPTREQNEFYKEVSDRYTDYIEYLESNNSNDLEVKVLPLNAKVLTSDVIVEGRGGDSPFGKPSILEQIETDVLKKPLKKEDIDKDISAGLEGMTPEQKSTEISDGIETHYDGVIEQGIAKLEAQHEKNKVSVEKTAREKAEKEGLDFQQTEDAVAGSLERLEFALNQAIERLSVRTNYIKNTLSRFARYFKIGNLYEVPISVRTDTTIGTSKGIFLGFNIKKTRKNPYAPSAINMRFAVNDSRRLVSIPLSKQDFINAVIANSSFLTAAAKQNYLDSWDSLQSTRTREHRFMVTGNLLQAYGTNDGQLVSYTDEEGNLLKGILLPESYKVDTQKRRIPINQAAEYLKTRGNFITTVDRDIQIKKESTGFTIAVPITKKAGGKYFLNKDLQQLVNERGFNQMAGKMVAYFTDSRLQDVLDFLHREYNSSIEVDTKIKKTEVRKETAEVDEELENKIAKDKVPFDANWSELEKDVWKVVLSKGRGLALANKQELKEYKNLIDEGLVYIDQWSGISLKLTDKGKELAARSNPDFSVAEDVSEEVQDLIDVIQEEVDNGITNLKMLQDKVAEVLEDDSEELRNQVAEAYTEYTKRFTPDEINEAINKRLSDNLSSAFGIDDAVNVLNEDDLLALADRLGDVTYNATPEQKATIELLDAAQAEYRTARKAFENKRKELGKAIVEDQRDLFGERVTPKAPGLFDERVSQSGRDKAMEPFKARMEKAEKEINRLQKKLDSLGNQSAQTSLFSVSNYVKIVLTSLALTTAPNQIANNKAPVATEINEGDLKARNTIKKLLTDYYAVNNEEVPQEVIDRAIKVWDRVGRPLILPDSTKNNDRAFANNEGVIVLGNITDFEDLVAELSHAAQYSSKAQLERKGYATQEEYDAVEYDRPGSIEYDAHKFIEPMIAAYILHGKKPDALEHIQYDEADRIIGKYGLKNVLYQVTMPNGSKKTVKPVDVDIVNGFYSPLEKTINEFKGDRLPAKQWADKFKGEEAKWTGLTDWLNSKINDAELFKGKTEIKKYPDGRFVVRWKDGGGAISDFLKSEKEAQDFTNGIVSKADIQKFLKENRIEVVEVVKEDNAIEAEYERLQSESNVAKEKLNAIIRKLGGDVDFGVHFRQGSYVIAKGESGKDAERFKVPSEYESEIDGYLETMQKFENYSDEVESDVETQYGNYQLPGEKTNYKEVLITMPQKEIEGVPYQSSFKSNHWSEPNILAHVRMNTRAILEPIGLATEAEFKAAKKAVTDYRETLWNKYGKDNWQDKATPSEIAKFKELSQKEISTGNKSGTKPVKVLFIEELQSDWGEIGRKKGFALPNEKLKAEKVDGYWVVRADNGRFITNVTTGVETAAEAIKEAESRIKRDFGIEKGVPSAPFVTDTNAWTKLAFKVALKEAVKQGADKIAWTTGEQQADRYDLSKHINLASLMSNKDGTYNLVLEDKMGEEIPGYSRSGKTLTPKELEDTVGKDVAQKLIEGADKNADKEWVYKNHFNPAFFTLDNTDLKVGGEGMTGFYGNPAKNKLGIVGNVAKSLFKQEPKITKIFLGHERAKDSAGDLSVEVVRRGEKWIVFNPFEGEDYSFNSEGKAWEYADKLSKKENEKIASIQHSVDITPEMKAQVQGGQPLFMKSPEGKVLGFTHNGKIYLNGKHLNPNTPIHEAGHLHVEWLKQNNIPVYNRGIELISGSAYLDKVKNNPFYINEAAKLDKSKREEFFQHEALATAIGDKGAQFVTEAKKKGFAEWLKNLWETIKNALGLENITAKELSESFGGGASPALHCIGWVWWYVGNVGMWF